MYAGRKQYDWSKFDFSMSHFHYFRGKPLLLWLLTKLLPIPGNFAVFKHKCNGIGHVWIGKKPVLCRLKEQKIVNARTGS